MCRLKQNLSGEKIYDQRKTRFLKIGRDRGFKKSSDTTGQQGLGYIEPSFNKIARFFENKKMISVALGALILVTILYLLV